MRLLKLPRLLILAFALLLVGGQQAALAHMIGHVADYGSHGEAAHSVATEGDADHGAALTLSHVCTTCLTLDTFSAPLPALPPLAFAAGTAAVPPAPTFLAHVAPPPRPYSARAPPAPL
ncbi:MAG: DUF2946 family protein [Gammaproteobacteria bacterium]|nr:DUF2946 family protein [Gammaproteobacteria bacterium]MBU1972374.1 DUF2946 family protein [Gammaproteobacteria bacterium]